MHKQPTAPDSGMRDITREERICARFAMGADNYEILYTGYSMQNCARRNINYSIVNVMK